MNCELALIKVVLIRMLSRMSFGLYSSDLHPRSDLVKTDAQKFVGSSRFRARTFESENLRFEARGVKPRLLSRG